MSDNFLILRNRQSDKHATFLQRLARRSGVRKYADNKLLSTSLFFISSHNYFRHFLCTSECNTLVSCEDRLSESMLHYAHFYAGRLFAQPLTVAVLNGYENLAFRHSQSTPHTNLFVWSIPSPLGTTGSLLVFGIQYNNIPKHPLASVVLTSHVVDFLHCYMKHLHEPR